MRRHGNCALARKGRESPGMPWTKTPITVALGLQVCASQLGREHPGTFGGQRGEARPKTKTPQGPKKNDHTATSLASTPARGGPGQKKGRPPQLAAVPTRPALLVHTYICNRVTKPREMIKDETQRRHRASSLPVLPASSPPPSPASAVGPGFFLHTDTHKAGRTARSRTQCRP